MAELERLKKLKAELRRDREEKERRLTSRDEDAQSSQTEELWDVRSAGLLRLQKQVIYQFIDQSVCLSVSASLSICQLVCRYIYPCLCLSACLSICLSVCCCIFLSIYLSVCLSFSLCISFSICLSLCLVWSVSLSLLVCLAVCISVSLSVCRVRFHHVTIYSTRLILFLRFLQEKHYKDLTNRPTREDLNSNRESIASSISIQLPPSPGVSGAEGSRYWLEQDFSKTVGCDPQMGPGTLTCGSLECYL